jgi:hypothetical protein
VNEGSSFVHHEAVRFRDLDGMGHVWNAVLGYDYGSGKSAAIPDRWKRRLSE